MQLKIKAGFLLLLLISLMIPQGLAEKPQIESNSKPIVLLIVDKMDTVDLLQSELPNVQRLLHESAVGLLNIRSESGYTNTNSAYLTVGAGNRAKAPGVYNGGYNADSMLDGSWKVSDFWGWSVVDTEVSAADNLMIPEIGWISRQFGEREAIPGMMGRVFRNNGWRTLVLGNADRMGNLSRPGALMLMDESGLVDSGAVDREITQRSEDFPYGIQFSTDKALKVLVDSIQPHTLLAVEYGDFARLDNSSEDVLPEQYANLKKELWNDFDSFLGDFLDKYSREDLNLLVFSPSLAHESWKNRHSLSTLVIRSTDFAPGLLSSGTTRWNGVVANLDILPTLVKQAGLETPEKVSGRTIQVMAVDNHVEQVKTLNERLNVIFLVQRALLDNYMLVIYLGWFGGLLLLFLKRRQLAIACFMTVVWSALVLLLLPLLPPFCWNVLSFYILTVLGGLLFFTRFHSRIFAAICMILWLVLTVDQMTGWNLIRYCGLGYSASAGSRYYGMGNELMGTYLAAAFMSAHYLTEWARRQWLIWPIVLISLAILLLPCYGADFGGTLSLSIALLFYIYYRLMQRNKQQILWIITACCVLLIIAVGLWDAARPPELQTHVGMFFRLFLNLDFNGLALILLRKLMVNLRLLVFSPWSRVVLSALGIIIVLRCCKQLRALTPNAALTWYTMLTCAIAAELLNDSGIVAMGTYLAVALTFYVTEGLKEEKNS